MRRVVITGMGIKSPVGGTLVEAGEALKSGRSGIRAMPEWADLQGLFSLVAGPVEMPDPKLIPRSCRRTMGRMALLATFAADDAVHHAGLTQDQLASTRTGVAFGSTTGSTIALEEFFAIYIKTRGFGCLDGTLFPKIMGHTVAANVAGFLGTRGRLLAPCSACASSLQAIGAGYEAIRGGMQDVMICGGAEDLHPSTVAVFDVLSAASRGYNSEPTRTPRPFDAKRDGVVISEGAGAVVLEDLDHALGRGATPLAEILGYETLCHAVHMTQPDEAATAECIRSVLDGARLDPGDIDYVHAHATGTPLGDAIEASALRGIFGDSVPVSSTKGYTGHMLAASGVVGVIFCLIMMRDGFIAPTLNLDEPGLDCAGIGHVRKLVRAELRRVVCNSFAFGGVGASLVLGRHP